MDKEWIHLPSRLVPEYEEGVQKFLAQARNYAKTRDVILCPCKRCKNKKYMKFDQVYDHLIIKGFDPSYTIWAFHGESYNSQSQDEGSSGGVQKEDESREEYHLYWDVFVSEEEVGHTMSKAKDYEFADLLEDAETPLFPGCTPSKVGASVQQNGNVKKLQAMVHNLQQEMQEMKSMFLQSLRQHNQQEHVASGGVGSGIGNGVSCSSDLNIGGKQSDDFGNVKKCVATAQSNLKNGSRGDIRANTKCKLLHWCVDGLIVAEGRIASTDPNAKVHNVVLGGSCWKVWVDKVLVEKVDLIRPNDEMHFLDDAIGSTIAWLSKFIVLCD